MTRVLPTGPKGAPIYFLGQAPGYEEVATGKPFVGKTSFEFDRILRELGVDRQGCRLGNVFQTKPPKNYSPDGEDIENYVRPKPYPGFVPFNGGFVREDVKEEILECWRDISEQQPNVVVALGEIALWALTGQFGIQSRRGFVIPSLLGPKVVPAFHPALIARDYSSRWLVKHDIRRGIRESVSPLISDPGFSTIVRPSLALARDYLLSTIDKLNRGPLVLSCDIETRGNHIACIGFGTSSREAFCLPLMCVERRDGYWSADDEFMLVTSLRKVLSHPNVRLVGQNFLFDAQFIEHWWFTRPVIYRDTALMQHTLFPMFRKALDFLVTLYSKHPRYWKADGKYWDTSIPEDQLWRYNCMDCGYTYEVYQVLEELADRDNKREQMKQLHEEYNFILDMMRRGVLIDENKREEFKKNVGELKLQKQAFLDYVVGHKFKANSPKMMKTFFYHDLGMKEVLHHKTHKPTCDDRALQTLARREPILRPLVKALTDIRSLNVFNGTFLEAEADEDGRMRCNFNSWATKTYRFSSSENVFGKGTNLQNIPSGNEIPEIVREAGGRMGLGELQSECLNRGLKPSDIDKEADSGTLQISDNNEVFYLFSLPNVRRMFVPDHGYTIFDMDLDRADLQVVVWETGDVQLKHFLRTNVDMHTENAKLLGISRQAAKMFVHLTNYGGSARTAAASCGLLVHDAEAGQRKWFGEHPGILEWHKRTKRALARDGIIWNKFGLNFQFLGRPEQEFTKALAWTPQSTVARVINTAFLNNCKNLPFVKFLLQVHDSLVFQLPTEMATNDNVELIREHALVRVPYEDPLVIPVSFKASTVSWGDCRKWAGGA